MRKKYASFLTVSRISMISLPRCMFVLTSARNQVTVRPRLTFILHLVQKNNTFSEFLKEKTWDKRTETTCLDCIWGTEASGMSDRTLTTQNILYFSI